ncbi:MULTISPECIES: hypothetical protein [Bacillaceae]|uniref:YcaO domain-containing protein n=1 Tax=Alkalicoccobacillus plakortidis TaxID=444060 RepID=A0A9D5HZ01_9BACI|nr:MULTISPECIES: hypothetical protein [Bacillaceae]KQL58303.1 hypothetical protein AN965_04390 [Alkalicoccobacillus plakortidis]
MIFTGKKNYGTVVNDFLVNPYISYTNLGSVQTVEGNTPSASTGIDKKKHISLIKAYQEHLERRRMGFANLNNIKVKAYNHVRQSEIERFSTDFGYGKSNFYGHSDTTGSASGLCSVDIKKKALTELLEKNEMYLFWYKKLGFKVMINNDLHRLINSFAFYSERIEMFFSKNITNCVTVFVILIANNRIQASGVALDSDFYTAFRTALAEAYTIEWQIRNNPLSHLNNYSDKFHEGVVKYVDYLSESLSLEKPLEVSNNPDIEVDSWITSIDYHVLPGADDNLTIKCASKNLYNCLPQKKYILSGFNRAINQIYNIKKQDIRNTPECILL